MFGISRGQPEGYTRSAEIRAILDRYEDGDPDDEVIAWDGLTVDEAIRLSEHLPESFLNRNQNFSPTVREMIAPGRDYAGTRFFGYRVSPEREDERISFEGFYLPAEHAHHWVVEELEERLRPDESHRWSYQGERCHRFWWD